MVTLRDSLLSSSARVLAIRKRPDLVARRQSYLGRSYWIVKDPVGLQYFRFHDEEFAILNMLDGMTSLDEIKERFEAEFPPQKITLEELQQFLGMLHRSGLVVADVAGQGVELRKRRDERKRKERLAALTNILCIRFKGFDPERFLNWLYPYVRWFFTKTAFALSCILALSAASLVIVEFEHFRSKLPEFQQFFNIHNAFLLAVVLGVTKVFHEFGHGLSCKHFGGECHEMGVMVLVLTPCLYCNVSDSWMLPNKWHRAAIGAAGIYVEIVLSSICTFLWWFSEPGLFHNLCLNVMFISSITTIVFNANPLLRYDGYYILADLMEIPNLRQKATTILSRKLGQWFLGLEPPEDPFLPQRNQVFFALYSVAAACYRWVVTFSICWFLYKLFDSYDLKVIGQGIVLMSLYGLFIMPLYRVGKFFYVPGRLEQVKKARFYTSLGGVIALLLAFLFVPLPHSVMCPLEIQARNAKTVSVRAPSGGRIISPPEPVKAGQRVTKGQLLAELENHDIDLAVAKIEAEVQEARTKLDTLRQQSIEHRQEALAQMALVEEGLKAAERQLREKKQEQEELRLIAPEDGTVLPPTLVERHENDAERLPAWSGTPLETRNTGAFLERGTVFCQIGDPTKLDAVIVIEQSDMNLIRAGQSVLIKLEGLAADTYESKVTEIAESELKISPPRLSNKHGGELATKTDTKTGEERPMSTSYQARAPIEDADGAVLLGVRGQARIYTDWIPLGTRLWRLITHTFNFKM